MKKTLLSAASLAIVLLTGCEKGDDMETKAELELESMEQKVSYTIGVSIAENVNVQDFAFDLDAFSQAVADVKAGRESQMNEEEMRATMRSFQTLQREAAMKKAKAEAETNRAAGQAFLDAKAQEEGVQKTESGLQYKVITQGEGEIPTATDQVVAHYKGTLIDGSVFDSSYDRGQPATFGVSNLIPGWVEALQLMPAGSKWELYIPSELGYGERGTPSIPPGSTLIFELELIEIKKEQAEG
jgi:FKBP-type peptidyl-prolyl cis-trans isomerase FkpA/FKBP-type peptidyl-prolyl cis-trans isomerase FklB